MIKSYKKGRREGVCISIKSLIFTVLKTLTPKREYDEHFDISV